MSERELSDIIECDGSCNKTLFRGHQQGNGRKGRASHNLARNNGIRTPKIHELVKDGNRWGYSYEKIIGPDVLRDDDRD